MEETNEVLLLGAGPMAVDYAKVLKQLGTPFKVFGRGESSARQFEQSIGVPVARGQLGVWLTTQPNRPSAAIVTVSENMLGEACLTLMQHGIKSILVEKPGGADAQNIATVAYEAERSGSQVYVGYNRRFYAAVRRAASIIKEDGGITSFHFEFTEWSHVISELVKAPGVKEHWFLHNSTHVIDLAFYLGGTPLEMSCFRHGCLPWHPSGSTFAGAGQSTLGAVFSYHANWEAPGRWGVELLTKKHRLILRPLEKLQIQKIGSTAIEPVELDDSLDTRFKPGLYLQTMSFLSQDKKGLPSIFEQLRNLKSYEKMRGGL